MTKEYYEKYWSGAGPAEGVAHEPPSWQKDDLVRVLDFIGPHCRGRVLDFGCGEGTFTFQLKGLAGVKQVTGSDISDAAVEKARQQYPGIHFVTAQEGERPFQDGSFDFICLVEVAEHLVDVAAAFDEAYRLLAPGGKILITTTDFNLPKKILIAAFFWDKYFYPTNPHIRFFTKATLAALLKKSGFDVVAYRWHGSYAGFMPKGQMVIARKRDKSKEPKNANDESS